MEPCIRIALIWTIECREFSERLLSFRKNVYVSDAFSQTHKVERRRRRWDVKSIRELQSRRIFLCDWQTKKNKRTPRKRKKESSICGMDAVCAFGEEDEAIDGNEEESWIDNLPRCRLLLIVSRCNDDNLSFLCSNKRKILETRISKTSW